MHKVNTILCLVVVFLFIGFAVANFPIARATGLSLDGVGYCSNGNKSMCSSTLTTTGSSDVIMIAEGTQNSHTTLSPSDTDGLTWILRNTVESTGNALNQAIYYAITTAPLSSDTVTCNFNTNARSDCIFFGVSGALTSAPFDTNSQIPCTAMGTSEASECTISTNSSPDMILGFTTTGCDVSVTADSGFTLIRADSMCAPSMGVEYQISSSQQTNLSVGMTLGASGGWVISADAIVSASAASSTTSSSTTSSSSSTSTTSSSTTSSQSSTTSSTSTSSTTSTSTSTTSSPSGRWNYMITNGGNDINNFTITGTITQSLAGISTLSGAENGNWSVILNAYAPVTFQNSVFSQFAVCVGTSSVLFEVDVFKSNSGLVYINEYTTQEFVFPADSNYFQTGDSVSISLISNSTGFTTAAVFSVSAPASYVFNGSQQTITDTISYTFNIPSSYSTPVLAVNPVLVGYPDGGFTTFTGGSVSMTFSSSNPLSFQSTVPSYVWSGGVLNESSNAQYNLPTQVSTSKITQIWTE